MNNDLISGSAPLEAMPKNNEIFSFEVRKLICIPPPWTLRWCGMGGGFLKTTGRNHTCDSVPFVTR